MWHQAAVFSATENMLGANARFAAHVSAAMWFAYLALCGNNAKSVRERPGRGARAVLLAGRVGAARGGGAPLQCLVVYSTVTLVGAVRAIKTALKTVFIARTAPGASTNLVDTGVYQHERRLCPLFRNNNGISSCNDCNWQSYFDYGKVRASMMLAHSP